MKIDVGKWHQGQYDIFFNCKSRRRVIAKGRRWGFTQGAAQFVISTMLESNDNVFPVMWGDTVTQNINNYVERYFLPVLNSLVYQGLPKIWDWKKHERKLIIGKAICDFRSADRPENWEGFGYKLIILNEAGIILKDQYLWNNAVRPMLMDFPDSIAIIGGTPKGKNLFWELHNKGGVEKDWESFIYSSYSNPFIDPAEVDKLVNELPESVVRQEIYAGFTDETANILIPYDLIVEAMNRPSYDTEHEEIWGVDIARHGDDLSVLAKRKFKEIYEVKSFSIPDTMQLASHLYHCYNDSKIKPRHIFIEVTGMGYGVYDRLRELGAPVLPADVGMKSAMDKVLNKRAEMYIRLKNKLKEGLKLPDDRRLLRQLSNVYFEYNDKANMKLVAKEQIKDIIMESPDLADACALTYYEDIPQGLEETPASYKKKYQPPKRLYSWMGK